MQFQVPQFIEVEDKIFGPLTFKQFVFVAGGLGFAYMLWRILPVILAAPLILGVVGLAAALAFMQFNGRPFILALESGFYYFIHSKLYLWNNEKKKRVAVAKPIAQTPAAELYVPKLSDSKLHELSWSLDIKDRVAAGVAEEGERLGGARLDALAPMRTPEEVISHIRSGALAR